MSKELRVDTFYVKYIKRVMDIVAGVVFLGIIGPFLLVIALMVKLCDGGSVFYLQERVGRNFKLFRLIKFRTMIEGADKIGPLITMENDPRITPVGKFLRRYKLDELPQLINVIKGDMSMVGPRPEVEKFVLLFREAYSDILKVRPGLTDYAAIEFRNEESVIAGNEKVYVEEVLPRKIELYYKYIQEVSFFTDLKIVFKTVWKVVFC